ncbi:hypothetical protein [Serratia marcescens]|uniref:hypothetical protein n=1 Tax=Serratia marcescens TaxID=615 RepID=UPI0029D4C8EF|nr:hypothetical protein [Serratia marcescens]
MTLNISGSGGTPPLVQALIDNVSESIEKIEQAVSLPQQNRAVNFSNGNNAEFMQQVTAFDGAAQQGGLMQKLLMLIGLQQLLGGGETQPPKQSARQPEKSAPVRQPSSSDGVIQQLLQMLQQVMSGKDAQDADGVQSGQNEQQTASTLGLPEAPASGKHSQGGVNGQIQKMIQQLIQIMQQLADGGLKNAQSAEGGNILSKLLDTLLQMVGMDALMSKLGGMQHNRE